MIPIRRILLVVLVVLVGGFIALRVLWNDPRIALSSQQPYSRAQYFAFVQPWGGDQNATTKWWGTRADTIHVDPQKFPDNSAISWRWPYWAPNNEVSVWAYDHITYGSYDGGDPETPIPPRQVNKIKVLQQTFDWSGSTRFGRANLLTEFYLRRNPADLESKVLEIGWFFHIPAATRDFVSGGKQLGVYTDPQGRRWQVALNERFLTLAPVGGGDVTAGTIDMLAALKWLQQKRVITGNEWFTGVAIGVEPLKGVGSMQINRWKVDYR